jgi:hypothetical protein
MLIIAKIFATILAILVIARSFTDFKNKKESLTMTIFWVAVWLVIMILAFWPVLIDDLIYVLGGQRTGLGTVFGMAIVFVLFVNYRIYIKANRVEKAMDKMARQLALSNLEKKNK